VAGRLFGPRLDGRTSQDLSKLSGVATGFEGNDLSEGSGLLSPRAHTFCMAARRKRLGAWIFGFWLAETG
jgi:hypothetical protein